MTPVEHFKEFFDIFPANNPELIEKTFKIRHQVYCREFNYLPWKEDGPEIESDEYDVQSMHCLMIHKPTKLYAGSARLVLANVNKPELPLPFEKYCSTSLDKSFFDPDEFFPGQIAEFSRMAVIEEFRRRDGMEKKNLHAGNPLNEHRVSNFPVIPVCLILASLSMLIASSADYGFAMMEPRLERLMRRYGIIFESAGEPIDYHGWRSPYIIHRDNVTRYFKHGVGDLFFEVNQRLQSSVDHASQLNTAS